MSPSNKGDKLEDMFRVHNYAAQSTTYAAQLVRTGFGGTFDLDLYQINPTGTQLIQVSNGATSTESLTFSLAADAETIVAVSAFAVAGSQSAGPYRLTLTQTSP